MRALEVHPCQAVCVWRPTGVTLESGAGNDGGGEDGGGEELALFACDGCGSEWVRTEGWTPIGADGRVPPEVTTERRRD